LFIGEKLISKTNQIYKNSIPLCLKWINMGKIIVNKQNMTLPVHLKTEVELIDITQDQADQRIDNFLLTYLKGVPRSYIYRILRKGEVRVNKGRAKASYRLRTGDKVRIPPVRRSQPVSKTQPNQWVLDQVKNNIIYEDKGLLVINKPAGLAVHGGSGISYGVIEALRSVRPEARFLELVHRLDRETSGCLVIAKKRSMLRTLHELLRSKSVEKRYLALVEGNWQAGRQDVKAPLRKNVLSSGERIVRVDKAGKPAHSVFIPLTTCMQASLMELVPITGRTHQLRVHAAYAGHPIAGDEKYGDPAFNKIMRGFGLKRLFLHAHSIRFNLPDDGGQVQVTAPLDQALQRVVERIKLFDSR
jgi:23S rRNA pseudouridine955/2504/2580 synthase